MKAAAIFIFSALFLTGCARGPQEFRSPEGKFQVTFPPGLSAPKEMRHRMPLPVLGGTIEVVMVMAENSDGACAVSYNEFPPQLLDALGSLGNFYDGAQNGAVSNIGGRVEASFDVAIAGKKGRSFTFTATREGKEVYGRGDLLLVGTRLYQLLFMNTDRATLAGDDCKRFFQSFALNP